MIRLIKVKVAFHVNHILYAAELLQEPPGKLPKEAGKAATKVAKARASLQLILAEEGMKDCRPFPAGEVDVKWDSFKQQHLVCVSNLMFAVARTRPVKPKLLSLFLRTFAVRVPWSPYVEREKCRSITVILNPGGFYVKKAVAADPTIPVT